MLAESAQAKQQKDWDKVVNEVIKAEPEEKPQGEQALNEFFKDLYSKSVMLSLSHLLDFKACQATRTQGAR